MTRVAKTESARRGEVEYVPDQANLDAGQRSLVVDEAEHSPAAVQQQQQFHLSPSLPNPPPLAGPYIQWFAEHQGYVADLIRQQQEALQHQLAEMQQQQLAFMQQQQQVINHIITSMKVQALPCLGATLNSLGSNDAGEFTSDPDGNRKSKAWHNRHDQLLDGGKVRSLNKMAENSQYGSDEGEGREPVLEFRWTAEPVLNIMQEVSSDLAELDREQFTPPRNLPERPLDVTVDDEERFRSMPSTQSDPSEYGQHSPGVKTTPGTSQQQALAGPCDARGYVDDVIQFDVQKHHQSATVLPLHSLSILWFTTTEPWKSENVEFTGLCEVLLSLDVNVNISRPKIQFCSAAISQPEGYGAATEDRMVRKEVMEMAAGESPGGKFQQQIRSNLEFEPPPSLRRATLPVPGEPEKQKFCRNAPNVFCNKVDRAMFGTVDLRTVWFWLAGNYGSEMRMKANDVALESWRRTRSSVLGSMMLTQFDTLKQPTWSLGRPPEQFGGTGISASVSSTTSTTTAPSQSAVPFSRCARVLVPIRSSPGRLLMWSDLYHLY